MVRANVGTNALLHNVYAWRVETMVNRNAQGQELGGPGWLNTASLCAVLQASVSEEATKQV
jgi:hypothetical protein